MAKLTAKHLSGEAFDIEDLDLEKVTSRILIHELLSAGVIGNPEIPEECYGIVDKECRKVLAENKNLSEYGFVMEMRLK